MNHIRVSCSGSVLFLPDNDNWIVSSGHPRHYIRWKRSLLNFMGLKRSTSRGTKETHFVWKKNSEISCRYSLYFKILRKQGVKQGPRIRKEKLLEFGYFAWPWLDRSFVMITRVFFGCKCCIQGIRRTTIRESGRFRSPFDNGQELPHVVLTPKMNAYKRGSQ